MDPEHRSASPAPGEPIAVVGIGCRFPRASGQEAFWRLLRDGVDAITEVPKERWDIDALYDRDLAEPGTMNTRWGGFLEDVGAFASAFFGISHGEASSMDPQHRLLLEVSWEALENAGQSPEDLEGSATAVYVGIGNDDYARACFPDARKVNAYYASGNSYCFAANRISRFLDLRGPSISLDTGCSSSLFAVHLACQSLRSGEANVALAGGVNLILSPLSTVAASHAWLMAADGRCKSFDARADGYVRGEGCGMVVLKRLSDALRAGDPIRGVIRGTAINQDGRGSGLTMPNPISQEEVVRRALADAGVSPSQIDYIEAHGVGTTAADLAEASVLRAVFSAARPKAPCVVGSVKTNIGHLEWAAGVAALIKVLLSFEHEQIPRNLHFQALHPTIAASFARLSIPTEERTWPRAQGRARMAGINSFGLGGANAHLVLEEGPVHPEATSGRPLQVLTLSAKTEVALRGLAAGFAEHLSAHPGLPLADVCFTANTGRSHFPRRLAIVSASAAAAREELAAFAAGQPANGVRVGVAEPERTPKVVFLFSGQAPHTAGLFRALHRTEPVVRAAFDRCAEIAGRNLRTPLLSALEADDDTAASSALAAEFALEYALCELWRSWGVEPDAVLGEGVGTLAAAAVAGALRLEDAFALLLAPKAGGVAWSGPRIPIFSSAQGSRSATPLSAEAWRGQLRDAAGFSPALHALCERGPRVLVSVGSGADVLARAEACLPEGAFAFLPSLLPGPEDFRPLLQSLASLYVLGVKVDWAGFDRAYPRRKLALPTYPFERRRCWANDEPSPSGGAGREVKEAKAVDRAPAFQRRLSEAPPELRREALAALVEAEVVTILGREEKMRLDRGQGLFAMGMKSLMAIELMNRLQAGVGRLCSLPATLVFEYPTISELGAYLAREAFADLVPADAAPRPVSARSPAGALEAPALEPIAIIGMDCRFPGGADDPDAFFRLLIEGRDAITEVPKDRWNIDRFYSADPDAPGKMYSRCGGFLRDIKGFDPEFFGISPREAAGMDPQQRLMLEVSWQALENAGLPLSRLAGSQTGVFVGILGSEYHQLRIKRGDPKQIDAYYGTGAITSAVAGRISYAFGLRGPAMAVDTACSASLVAVHLACQSLRRRECDLALGGGVNLVLSPEGGIFLSRARALAADGRCKTFDASADGYVRAEGAGVVVLKRLSDALADGDDVLAVIASSATNQDGQSGGFTVPNGSSQKAVIQQALAEAGVKPSEVGYVEAHGTGTPLGDPIEARALGAVLSEGRPRSRPFLLGSVKTNIGHLEAAAGIAGLIKVVLSLQNGIIPPHLHLKQLNPRILPEEVPARIPLEPVPWPAGAELRIAGVSSFGLSGTNAHIIVKEAPPQGQTEPRAPAEEAPSRAQLLPLSARGEGALKALARAYRSFLSEGGRGSALSLEDVAYTAGTRRSHHSDRLAIVGRSSEEIVERLGAFLEGEARPGLSSGSGAASGRPPRIVFIFPGQGSQWPAMGRQLLREEPVFRATLEQCDQAFRAHVDWSLIDILCNDLCNDEAAARLEAIDVIQPVLFAIEVALASLWESWGVHPAAVIGHSMGEVAAAKVAGALRLEDAARVICRRSLLLRRVSGRGAMAVVDLPLKQAEALLHGHEDRLSIAVSNGPRSTVLSGDPIALKDVLDRLKRDNVFCRPVKVDFASHSPQMDPLRADLLEALAGLEPRAAVRPIYSTVTGLPSEGEALDAPYWMRNLREPVMFSAAVEHALKDGHDVFLELSPHPILLPAIEQVLLHAGRKGLSLPSLRREQDPRAELLSSLGALHTAGYPVEFQRLYREPGRLVSLPAYPWQNEPYWFEDPDAEGVEIPEHSGRRRRRSHPILGEHLELSAEPGLHLWEMDVDTGAFPYLLDHRVQGTVVLPGMAYVSMALSAAEEVFGRGPSALRDVEFHSALFLPEGKGARTVQTTVVMDGAEGAMVHVHSRSSRASLGGDADNPWTLHMSARIEQGRGAQPGASAPAAVAAIEARCGEEIARADFYRSLEEIGNQFGPRHQGIERLRRREGEALGRVALPSALGAEARQYFIHPAFLDACMQVGLAAMPTGERGGAELGVQTAFMPVRIERLAAHQRPGDLLWSHARFDPCAGVDLREDVRLFDDDGRVLLEVTGLEGRYLEREAESAPPTNPESWLYELAWRRKDRGEALAMASRAEPSGGAFLIFADNGGVGEALAKLLAARGEESVLCAPGDAYERVDRRRFHIRPGVADDMMRLLAEAFEDSGPPCRGVIHLYSLDAPAEGITPASLVAAQGRACASVFRLIQAVVRRGWPAPPRLWLITRGVQRIDGDTTAPNVAQAPLWGLGRVIAEEHPSLWGGLLDLCPASAPLDHAEMLVDQVRLSDGEDQIALRRGHRYVARLVQRPPGAGKARPLRLRTDGSYLITGGLGGIGLEVARWMVEQGARRLILMGRTPLPPRAEWASVGEDSPSAPIISMIRAMEALGASVHVAAVDVGDEAQLGGFLTSFRREAWPPIRGVVHAAAVVHDASLLTLDEEVLQADLRPKMLGGYLLHDLLADAPLDFFVLFSSGSAILSSPFLAAYAAANAFLDALSHHRRAQGKTALSINWGFWAEVGLAARRQRAKGGAFTPQGMGQFTPKQGLLVMKMLLERSVTQTLVAPVNWKVWSQFHPRSAQSPLFTEVVKERLAAEEPRAKATTIREELLRIEHGFGRRGRLEAYLQKEVGKVLRLSPSKVGLNKPIGSLGLDSLMGLELRNCFEASTGLHLPATLVWTYPTVAELANHLASQMNISLTAPQTPNLAAESPSDTPPPDDLSEEAAEAMLAEALAMVQQRRSNG
jgi:myxalamid-type polyketide synthase MxaE and MxaD